MNMGNNRRDFVIGLGAAAILGGCKAQTAGVGDTTLPGAFWPGVEAPAVSTPQPLPAPQVQAPTGPVGTPTQPVPRTQWTRASVDMSNINPMNGISRITLHHEGYKPFTDTDYASSAARVELVRTSHRSRGFSDIGYHFVVDRAGRVFQGRELRYQGAHVRNNNENNLGIMCLGNFAIQQPTDAQLTSLRAVVALYRRKLNVSPGRIFTHQEITATACPGKYLQPRILAMRSGNAFV